MTINFKEIATALFDEAEKLVNVPGNQKMDYVLDQIVKLDNATPLAIIPDKLESFALRSLVQKIFDEYKEHLNK